MPDSAGRKTSAEYRQNAKAPLPAKTAGFKTKKGTNATANPSYASGKIFLPHLLYIVYYIFRRTQIFVGFFAGACRQPAIGIQCSIRQPAQYLSAGIRKFASRQQLFAARRFFI
ncbi:hypothetical protein DWW20_16685 [Ruminococcus sp. AF14-5]|nr:hypothetical protein DWW20_16685 [Ruminococcus sp. AF14-5]